MIVTVTPAQPSDLKGLFERSIYAGNPEARKALNMHLKMSSEIWVGKADGAIGCVFGVITPSIISTQAYLWVVTTKVVDEHKFIFIRYSQRALEVLLQKYETIVGFCFVRETSAIKWLKFLGATFDEEPQEEKLPFKIRRTVR